MNQIALEAMRKTRINYSAIIVLNCILFEIGIIVSAVGALMRDIIRDLRLNYTLATFLPFSYYIAFGFISIPAGILSERFTAKKVVIVSFVLGLLGAFSFAMHPHYSVVLLSLFMIGCWLAAGQIPLNPLMRTACSGENLAFFTILTNMMYGLGSIVSPHLH